jgi:hypothetical protein
MNLNVTGLVFGLAIAKQQKLDSNASLRVALPGAVIKPPMGLLLSAFLAKKAGDALAVAPAQLHPVTGGSSQGGGTIPDRGLAPNFSDPALTIKDALYLAAQSDVHVLAVEGLPDDVVVTGQLPSAGQPMAPNRVVLLNFEDRE